MWFAKAMADLPHAYVNVTDFGYSVFRFFWCTCSQRLLNYLASNIWTTNVHDGGYSWDTIWSLTRVTRRVPILELGLLTHLEHVSLPPAYLRGSCCSIFCMSLFVCLFFFCWPLYRLFFYWRGLITSVVSANIYHSIKRVGCTKLDIYVLTTFFFLFYTDIVY